MRVRGWLALVVVLLLAGVAVAVHFLPQIVRSVAVGGFTRLRAARTVSIATVELGLLSGPFTVHGFRLTRRPGLLSQATEEIVAT